MALTGFTPTTVPQGSTANLSGIISTASGGELRNQFRHEQALLCNYSAVTILDGSWPPILNRVTGTLPDGPFDSRVTKGAYLLQLGYSVLQTLESTPILVGGGLDTRIAHELSGASFTSTTGIGTGGIVTTVQPGIKTRLATSSDIEKNIARFFPDVLLIPDPTFAQAELREQEQIFTWFMYRLLPQLITAGGASQTLGMGVVQDVGNYGFIADWAPGGATTNREPVPPCLEFKPQLMKI